MPEISLPSFSDDNLNTGVLIRCHRLLGRVVRAAVPIQALMLLLLGVIRPFSNFSNLTSVFCRLAALCHWTRTSWYAASRTTSNAAWSRCSSGATDPRPSETETDAKTTKKNEWNLTVYNYFVTQSITMIHLWNECDKVRWKLMLVLYAAFMDMQKCQNVKVVRVVKVKLFTCYDDTV